MQEVFKWFFGTFNLLFASIVRETVTADLTSNVCDLLLNRFSWQKARKPRIILFIIAAVVLCTELFDSAVAPLYWPSEKCEGCYRLLFVADPQIGGEQDEPSWLLRWDSDRYLSKWYAKAYSFVLPHAVLFLGDLMDEGSKATNTEFQRYLERFFSIFPVKQGVKYFYLPGDNDIGGEFGEPILPHVVRRFYRAFNKTAELPVGPVRFLKVNIPLEAPPISHIPNNDDTINILLSHFPLMSIGAFSRPSFSVKQFRPNLVISAHSHLSELRHFAQFDSTYLSGFSLSFRPDMKMEDVVEISIPTCSYRMGVEKMGYGSLVIDPKQRKLSYAVLWLPGRFPQLYFLAICGFLFVICILLMCCRVL